MNDSVSNNGATTAAGPKKPDVRSLELMIPPPAVAAVTCAAMWWISVVTPLAQVPASTRIAVALVIASVGGIFGMGAGVRFRRAKTTFNPAKPQTASSLVTAGIYKYTRNPMYLALVFVLVAWAVFLSSPWAMLGPVAFVPYISRFQIVPEERVLSGLFGAEYSAYQARVRRWL
jgi:protein-S-isoprenylcysteine O-methyltransferase Ste14